MTACQFAAITPTATPTIVPTASPTATVTPTPAPTPLPPNVLTASSCSQIALQGLAGAGQISQMVYSPDGNFLLIASAGGMSFYDAKQAKLLWNAITPNGIVQVTMDVGSQIILAIDTENTLYQLDMKSGKKLNSAEQGSKYMAFTFSSDGKLSAAASFDGMINQYDTEQFNQTGTTIRGPGAFQDSMLADSVYLFIRYSPDGKYLTVATLRAEVYLYSTEDGSLVKKIDPLDPDYDHRIFPQHVAFSQDGKKLAVEYQNGQTLLTETSGKQPGKLLEGSFPSLSADGSVLALKSQNGIEVFETSTGDSFGTLAGTEATLGNSIFSPGGDNLVVVMPRETVFWDLKELMVAHIVKTAFSDYQAMTISQNGETLAASLGQLIELYQINSEGRSALEWQHPAQFLKFAANDTLLVAAGATWLSVLDPKQKTTILNIELPETIQSMDVSSNGRTAVIVTKGHTARLYDLSSGAGTTISDASQKIISATFVDDTNILALDEDENVYVSTSQNPIFVNIKDQDIAASLSPDRSSLITFTTSSNDIRQIFVYDLTKHKMLESPVEYQHISAISPVNNIVVVPDAYEKTLTLADIGKSDQSCQIKDFNVEAKEMIFSPDGQYLILNGKNGIIYFFGTGDGFQNKNG